MQGLAGKDVEFVGFIQFYQRLSKGARVDFAGVLAMVSEMIALYCRKQHGSERQSFCPDCAALDAYARQRSDKCPFMETKTFCSNCILFHQAIKVHSASSQKHPVSQPMSLPVGSLLCCRLQYSLRPRKSHIHLADNLQNPENLNFLWLLVPVPVLLLQPSTYRRYQ